MPSDAAGTLAATVRGIVNGCRLLTFPRKLAKHPSADKAGHSEEW